MRVSGARWRRGSGQALVVAALLAAGCGAEEDTATTGALGSTIPKTTRADEPPPIRERSEVEMRRDGGDSEGHEAGPAPADEQERERQMVRAAQAAYREYVAAVNERNGAALCRLIAPGFEDELELPERGGSCAERMTRSIGFRDPRGFPVWKRTELGSLESAIVGEAGRVQLSVAIATLFADRSEPSVESDIAFLEPSGSGYVLARAPGSLWRAVGKPDVPPSVITPPPGF